MNTTDEATPEVFEGWTIAVKTGDGALGTETATATATKGTAKISATASSLEQVTTMVREMIRRRETPRN